MVIVGTTHLWMLRMRAHHSSAIVHLLLVRARSGVVAAFCLHTIRDKTLAQVVESLLQKGAIELAPLSSLGYYSCMFFVMKALGSWRPVINLSLLNLIVLKIHDPEGGVSASSSASEIQIVSLVHGVWQSLPIHGSLLWSLRGSAGLHAGHSSGFGGSPQSWIRLRPYLRDWLIQASSRE